MLHEEIMRMKSPLCSTLDRLDKVVAKKILMERMVVMTGLEESWISTPSVRGEDTVTSNGQE